MTIEYRSNIFHHMIISSSHHTYACLEMYCCDIMPMSAETDIPRQSSNELAGLEDEMHHLCVGGVVTEP